MKNINKKYGKLLLEVDIEKRTKGQYIIRVFSPTSLSTSELTSFYSDVEQVKETLRAYCKDAERRGLFISLIQTKDVRKKLGSENQQELSELVQSF